MRATDETIPDLDGRRMDAAGRDDGKVWLKDGGDVVHWLSPDSARLLAIRLIEAARDAEDPRA